MKTCPKCGETKHLDFFGLDRRTRDKKCCWCKACKNDSSYNYHHSNPPRPSAPSYVSRAQNLKRLYGITISDFGWMIVAQERRCKICKKDLLSKDTHVDHCHETGKVRGLLCFTCNTALGKFKDDPNILRAAIEYLEEFKS